MNFSLSKFDGNRGTLTFRGIAGVLLCLSLFLKPFYLYSSGSFQLSDACLALSFLSLVVSCGLKFQIQSKDALLVAFVASVSLINGYYAVSLNDNSFIIYTLYYVFILMSVLTFRYFLQDEEFLKKIEMVLRSALWIQLFVMVVGLGRWFDDQRFMGTFNDPNQFAVYVFFSFAVIKLVTIKTKRRYYFTDDVVAWLLVLSTASTGLLLSMSFYYVCWFVSRIKLCWGDTAKVCKTVLLYGSAFLLIAVVGLNISTILGALASFPVGDRVAEKISKIVYGNASAGTSDFFSDRQLTRIFYYPQYFLYGAGEGGFVRFIDVGRAQEMHSTWVGIAFYYGFVPFLLLIVWVVNNWHGALKDGSWIVILPLICESFLLANQRQPLFWMLIVLAGVCLTREKKKSFPQRGKRSVEEHQEIPDDQRVSG